MTLHILPGHTQIFFFDTRRFYNIFQPLEWVATGENEREDGRRKYTEAT